jgi:hypothetical protein
VSENMHKAHVVGLARCPVTASNGTDVIHSMYSRDMCTVLETPVTKTHQVACFTQSDWQSDRLYDGRHTPTL